MRRRVFVMAGAPLSCGAPAQAEAALREEWLGVYEGVVSFRRSLPLEDILPPPPHPRVDPDDRAPITIRVLIRRDEGGTVVWTRIADGPMQTADAGETLHFGALTGGVANLARTEGSNALRTATLTLRPDSLGTEALFSHADGSFWRRHLNLKFTPAGAEVILWVFDAAGTRARTWRGEVVRRPF